MLNTRAFWNGVDSMAAPAASLLTAGILARTLGIENYGALVIALAVAGISVSVNSTLTTTTTKLVAETRGRAYIGNLNIGGVISTSLLIMLAIDLLLVAVAFVFSGAISRMIFGAFVAPDNRHIVLFAVLVACTQQIDAVFAAAIKGLECFRQQALFEAGYRFILVLGAALIAYFTREVESVLISYCIINAFSALLRAIMLQRLVPEENILAAPGKDELSRVFLFGRWMWLNAIATAAYVTLDRVIVGRILGLSAAGNFSIYLQLAQIVHYVPAGIYAFLFPRFSRLTADDSRGVIRREYIASIVKVIGIAGVIALIIGTLHGHLIYAFTGIYIPEQDEAAFFLLLFGFAVLAITICPYYLMLGLGKSGTVSIITTLSMLVALGLAVLLTKHFGITGAAVARLGYVFGTLLLVVHARKALDP